MAPCSEDDHLPSSWANGLQATAVPGAFRRESAVLYCQIPAITYSGSHDFTPVVLYSVIRRIASSAICSDVRLRRS